MFLKKHVELVVIRTHLQKFWIEWYLRLFHLHSLILYGWWPKYLLLFPLVLSSGMMDF